MSIQTVIDSAININIDRRKLAGQTMSRSGHVKISSVASSIPWVFIVDMHNATKYSTNRSLFEEIDRMDRIFLETINIGSTNPGLAYITQYQGDFTPAQLNQTSVASASGLELVLDVSSVTGEASTDYVVKKGDYVQLDGAYKYPYTVTADVQRGIASTVTIPLSRPFIEQSGYTVAGADLVVGVDCTWNVVMSKKPSYNIVPHDRGVFSGSFELVEVIDD
jgi:hypothetical protein